MSWAKVSKSKFTSYHLHLALFKEHIQCNLVRQDIHFSRNKFKDEFIARRALMEETECSRKRCVCR